MISNCFFFFFKLNTKSFLKHQCRVWSMWHTNCIKFWKYDDETKDRVTYPFISAGHSHTRVDKRVLEHTAGVTTNLLPGYFIQGLTIGWWDHKDCPREGFNHPTEGLKLPVLMINIGLQCQFFATSHHFLRQKTRRWSYANYRTAWV